MSESVFHAGFAMIIGPPNAGKSTLLNKLLDFKLSIVTPKPQTTRKKIVGIYDDESSQIVFLDTPGILKPRQKLHESMLGVVRSTLNDADVLVAMLPYARGEQPFDFDAAQQLFDDWLGSAGKPVLVLCSKADLVGEEQRQEVENMIRERWQVAKVLSVSARKGFQLQELLESLQPLLPHDQPLFPPDTLTTAPERFFVSEIIREKIFLLYGNEIPYATEVVVDEFRENHEADPSRKDFVRCSIIVERDSQKQIVIGQQGSALKKLGATARKDIEAMLGRPVFLELFVKVRPDWRKKSALLKSYGY